MQLAQTCGRGMSLPFRLYLSGELGCGKTTFVRGVLFGFAAIEEVKSPSYALVETYTAGKHCIAHIDLYRCRHSREWIDSGFAETMHFADLCLIEWPEKVTELPDPDIHLAMSDGQTAEQRILEFRSYTRKGKRCLARL